MSHGHEQWHVTAVEEEVAQRAHGDVDQAGWRIFGIGMFLYFVVIAIIVVIAVYFFAYAGNLQQAREEFPETFGSPAIQQAQLDKRAEILTKSFQSTTSTWTNPTEGTVQLPLDKAMQKVVQSYEKKPK